MREMLFVGGALVAAIVAWAVVGEAIKKRTDGRRTGKLGGLVAGGLVFYVGLVIGFPSELGPWAKPIKLEQPAGIRQAPGVFRSDFNKIVAQGGPGYQLDKLSFETAGDGRRVARQFWPVANVGVIVTELDSGYLHEVAVAGNPNAAEAARVKLALIAAASAANYEVSTAENSQVVSEMLLEAVKGKPVSRHVGRATYTASLSDAAGLMFVVTL